MFLLSVHSVTYFCFLTQKILFVIVSLIEGKDFPASFPTRNYVNAQAAKLTTPQSLHNHSHVQLEEACLLFWCRISAN